MKPEPTRFLEVAAAHLLMQTAPAVGEGYEQSSIQLMAAMLMAVREEYDRAASRRVEENQLLRALFRDAAPVVADDALRHRLETQAAGEDPGLAVPELERANALLRALLIDLHAHVEELDSPEARRVEAAIWDELVASAERRKLSLGAF